MAFLSVNGTTIPVAQNSAAAEIMEIGDRDRTFDGTLRETIRSRLNIWSGETKPMDRDTATDVIAQLNASTQPQTCAGDLVSSSGGSGSYFTRAEGQSLLQSDSTHFVVVQWTIEESS